MIAASCGITVTTAVDLLLLTIGAEKLGWDLSEIRNCLERPGRQAISPPGCKKIGTVRHFYERPHVVSLAVDDSARIRVGDTIVIRLRDRYHQQAINSLQVNGAAVPEVPGGVVAGVQTSLHRRDVPIGALVFVVEKVAAEPAGGLAEVKGASAGEKPEDPPSPAGT